MSDDDAAFIEFMKGALGEVIAINRATSYASGFGNDVQTSLDQDTLPLFNSDPFEIEDWAENNMNWSDVFAQARLIREGETDYQEGWVNGEKEVKDL